MNFKRFSLPLFTLLLSACTSLPSSFPSSPISSLTSSSQFSSSSSPISSNSLTSTTSISSSLSSSSSSSSPTLPNELTSIIEIKNYAKTLTPLITKDYDEVVTSEKLATITAQLLTVIDHTTTKSGYTSRYKAVVGNDTGIVYVALSDLGYTYIKDYIHQKQTYTFKGKIGLYNLEAEIVMEINQKPLLSAQPITFNLNDFATEITQIATLQNQLKDFKVNTKGTGFTTSLYKLTLKYLAKLENSLALFTDGEKVIQVHGDDKLNNQFNLSSIKAYTLYGLFGLFGYKAEFKFIAYENSDVNISFDYLNFKTHKLTGNQLYTHKPKVDDHSLSVMNKNYAYAELFFDIYLFEGYANFYIKGVKENLVFDDTTKNYYSTQENAYHNFALFVNNSSCQDLAYANLSTCPYVNEAYLNAIDKSQQAFYFIPYLANSVGYWQIHILA